MKKTSTVRVKGNMIFNAGRSTAFWMKRAKSFWNRNYRRHRKR